MSTGAKYSFAILLVACLHVSGGTFWDDFLRSLANRPKPDVAPYVEPVPEPYQETYAPPLPDLYPNPFQRPIPDLYPNPFQRQIPDLYQNLFQRPIPDLYEKPVPEPVGESLDDILSRTNRDGVADGRSSRSGSAHITDGLDMGVTLDQFERLYTAKRSMGRSASTEPRLMATVWTDGVIPYEIVGNFDADQRAWIKKGMKSWEDVTCIKFRPAVRSDPHRIQITNGAGCSAILGMSKQKTQTVILENGCFWKGLIEHELGHSIGLIHEHQRNNRDEHIRVNYYNVKTNLISAVTKYAPDVDDKMGLDYDYKSVMHYGKTAFHVDSSIQTLHTRDPTMTDVIGMTLKPSFLDAKLVNLMYKCSDRCRRPPRCNKDCYVDENCRCICEEDRKKEVCKDVYPDCEERKWRGECSSNSFKLHTFCRKTCGVCTDNGAVPQLLCMDTDNRCNQWAMDGKCKKEHINMFKNCPQSCGWCSDYTAEIAVCEDNDRDCRKRAANGDCDRDTPYMLTNCRKSCDFCPGERTVPTVRAEGGVCGDVDTACTYWRDNGKCKKDYTYMLSTCGKSCRACEHKFKLPADCVDDQSSCRSWAEVGECTNNPGYMTKNCKRACNSCGIRPPSWLPSKRCIDIVPSSCPEWKIRGECQKNPKWMRENCALSCGTCTPEKDSSNPQPQSRPRPVTPAPTPAGCADTHSSCPAWARDGQCTKNPSYMLPNCKKSCGQCSGGQPACEDERGDCVSWARGGQCQRNPGYMLKHCKKSCGEC